MVYMPPELQDIIHRVYKARQIWFMENRSPEEPEVSIYIQEDI